MKLPENFENGMRYRLGEEGWYHFHHSLSEAPPVSVRIHPIKYSDSLTLADSVPWCKYGFYLEGRPVFTLDPAFHSGGYYVQEASSMVIWHILEKLLGDNKNITILDLCGAPGGKSSLIADWLCGNGILMSNEVIRPRSLILRQNLMKSGYDNIIISNNDPSDLGNASGLFDVILVDAPCSGEGMFRKDPQALKEWSSDSVHHCSMRQKRILSDILPALKDGGHLIYSTCTYNEAENIDNIHWLSENYPLQCVSVGLESFEGISPVQKGPVTGYQFYPHLIKGEGFFVSVLQKSTSQSNISKGYNPILCELSAKEKAGLTQWVQLHENMKLAIDKSGLIHALADDVLYFMHQLPKGLRFLQAGVTVGQLNKDIVIPDHHLALSYIAAQKIPRLDLTKNDALLYLKKELAVIQSEQRGWVLLTYRNQVLGWCKNLGNRINNYLPNEWRIRMDLLAES